LDEDYARKKAVMKPENLAECLSFLPLEKEKPAKLFYFPTRVPLFVYSMSGF
jgi:hypothetical protein